MKVKQIRIRPLQIRLGGILGAVERLRLRFLVIRYRSARAAIVPAEDLRVLRALYDLSPVQFSAAFRAVRQAKEGEALTTILRWYEMQHAGVLAKEAKGIEYEEEDEDEDDEEGY